MVLLSCALGLCYHISRAHDPIIGFKGSPELLNGPLALKVDNILDLAMIFDICAVSWLYFEYDVALGLFYQTPKAQAPRI